MNILLVVVLYLVGFALTYSIVKTNAMQDDVVKKYYGISLGELNPEEQKEYESRLTLSVVITSLIWPVSLVISTLLTILQYIVRKRAE